MVITTIELFHCQDVMTGILTSIFKEKGQSRNILSIKSPWNSTLISILVLRKNMPIGYSIPNDG